MDRVKELIDVPKKVNFYDFWKQVTSIKDTVVKERMGDV